MDPSGEKGNNPDKWDELLSIVDDKLQLRLLDSLKRVASYHFEESVLYIEPSSEEDYQYLSQPSVVQHLELLVNDALRIDEVTIKDYTLF